MDAGWRENQIGLCPAGWHILCSISDQPRGEASYRAVHIGRYSMSHRELWPSLLNCRRALRMQVRFLGMWLVMAGIMAVALVVGSYFMSDQLWRSYLALHAPLASEAFARPNPLAGYVLFSSVLLITGICALAIHTGHRVAGPYQALKRTFNEVREGNLECRLRFRSTDGLDDVAASFNEMMDAIRSRAAPARPSSSAEPRLKVIGE
jgi:HAMP domain-containing protein